MSGVASKNIFELLGNDPDEEPQAPVQAVEKPTQRTGKRDAGGDAPAKELSSGTRGGRGGRAGRQDGSNGSEQAFQDVDAGRTANRGKPVDDAVRSDRHPGGRNQRGEGRGSRGGRGGRGRPDDRHSRTGQADSTKQAAHGWGDETGVGEWNDEKEGQAIAWEEEKKGYDAWVEAPANAEGEIPATTGEDHVAPAEPQPEPEPEDKSRSYAEYLAEQAEKKLQLGSILSARKPNEGAVKKQPEGKELARDEDDYFAGSGGKQRRERERKEKNTLVLDHDMLARERESGRGGRGRGRGRGEFRGEFRGEGGRGAGFRGDGFRGEGGRGRGRGRGEFRGRGGGRGGTSPNVSDESAFPSLGA